MAHSKEEINLNIDETLEEPKSKNLIDKTPITDLNNFIVQEFDGLVLDLPMERPISECVVVDDLFQPIQVTEKVEVSYTIEECLAYFEDWDDLIIRDIVNALRKTSPVPTKTPSMECNTEVSKVEASVESDFVKTIPTCEEEIQVSTSLWFVETKEHHLWDNPYLNNFFPYKLERRFIFDEFQPKKSSFRNAWSDNFEKPSEFFQQDFQWIRMTNITHEA